MNFYDGLSGLPRSPGGGSGCACSQCAPGPPQAKTYTSFLDNIGITVLIIHSKALRSFFVYLLG